jgi:hypothetical protein
MRNLLHGADCPALVQHQKLIGLSDLVSQEAIKAMFETDLGRARWPPLSHASGLD